MGALSVAQHVERAQRHRKVGDALAAAGDEWAAVCYFYSAFHLVRHALRTDPIFDDPTALSRIRPDLRPELRDVERHHGRFGTYQRRVPLSPALRVNHADNSSTAARDLLADRIAPSGCFLLSAR